MKGLILPTPIGLDSEYVMIELVLNHALEVAKALKNFRLIFKQIDPSELTKVVNKAHIVRITASRGWGRPPHIAKHKLKRFR